MDNLINIDITGVGSREELHKVLRKSLDAPDYYGDNLDALYDVLTEKGEHKVIFFFYSEQSRNALGEYFDMLTDVCLDASAELDDLKVNFIVV